VSQYIKGRQIPVASDIARQLDDIKMKINELTAQARKAGLNDDANAIDSIREHLYDVSSRLERKARDAYAAARRGEELPK
jgi:predicted transcriptional regulator